MLIYKSFFRKKTTKIYLVIYSLIILVIGLLLSSKMILSEKQQELYYGSNILIYINEIEKLNNVKNIDKIYKAIRVNVDGYNEMVMVYDEKYNVDNYDIVIPNIYKEQFKINDIIKVNFNNMILEFVVKEYDNMIGNNDILYVSGDVIEAYKKEQENSYLITLKDWNMEDETVKELNKMNNIKDMSIRINNSSNSYTTFINILNVMLIVIMVLFIIVLVITSFNIIEEENKKNLIYYKIGYRNKILKFYNLKKILMLLFFACYISIFIMFILKLVYNIIF